MGPAECAYLGVVYIDDPMGRVLRKGCATLEVRHVLDSSGDFRVGDRVYVVMRTRDGSQYVVASGRTCLDAATLDRLDREGDAATVVIRELEMSVQWP